MLLGASMSERYMYIVTEYCSRGSLFDLIHDQEIEFSWNRQLKLVRFVACDNMPSSQAIDSARGMLYLHERNPKVVHRDLKSSNLLVDKAWNVKVADFGLSTLYD